MARWNDWAYILLCRDHAARLGKQLLENGWWFEMIGRMTEDERHDSYQYAQRKAYEVAKLADSAKVGINSTGEAVEREMRRAEMWATVAVALRRDGGLS